MTLSDLASIGSLVSGLAVLISLIYLAQQTRQNAKHTMALIHQGRAEQMVSRMELLVSDPSLLDVVLRGQKGDSTLDDLQWMRYLYSEVRWFYTFKDLFFQHRDGLISHARHAGTESRIRERFQSPGARAMWKLRRNIFDSEFQAFMNGLMREADLTPMMTRVDGLRALVAAELAETTV